MVFGGIQKLTLLDYPDKTACTLFTVGCNFACPYCQNASLVCPPAGMQTIGIPEVFEFLKKRKGLIEGVCISGGEPLLHNELDDFILDVKALGFLVKLDTNGSYPERLKKLVSSGTIDYIAMDIKNTPEKYAQTIGLNEYDISAVEESISFLCAGAVSYEFRTTVVREFHTADELESIARWIVDAQKYYLQGFVDTGDILKSGYSGYSKQEMLDFTGKLREILPATELRGY